jgi:hypothetical protein
LGIISTTHEKQQHEQQQQQQQQQQHLHRPDLLWDIWGVQRQMLETRKHSDGIGEVHSVLRLCAIKATLDT